MRDLVHIMKSIREAFANPITSIMLASNVLSKLDNNIDVCRYKMGIWPTPYYSMLLILTFRSDFNNMYNVLNKSTKVENF